MGKKTLPYLNRKAVLCYAVHTYVTRMTAYDYSYTNREYYDIGEYWFKCRKTTGQEIANELVNEAVDKVVENEMQKELWRIMETGGREKTDVYVVQDARNTNDLVWSEMDEEETYESG